MPPLKTRPDSDEDLNPGNRITSEKLERLEATPIDVQRMQDGVDALTRESAGDVDQRVNERNLYEKSAGGKKRAITFKGMLKRRGPLAGIAALLVGGGGILSFLFTPALGLINLKEVLMDDLNDQLSAFDLRSDAMLRSKLSNISTGVCSNAVKIKCQFTTMSKKQIARFQDPRSGFTDVVIEDRAFGRQKIISMVAPNGTVINNPQDLVNLRTDPTVRSSLNRIFNPVYASLTDAVADGKIALFGASKRGLVGTNTEALRESLSANVAGEVQDDPPRFRTVDGNRVVQIGEQIFDENSPQFRQAELNANQLAERAQQANTGGKAVSGVLTGALRGAAITGAADTLCSVYNLSRAVSAAAKATRSAQLARYSMTWLSTADKIVAGDATPEEVAFLGEIASATDTRETVINETGTPAGAADADRNFLYDDANQIENPNLGKSLYDSAGYSVAAYGDAPTLRTDSLQYTIGGGLVGNLDSVNQEITSVIGTPEQIRNTCGVVQSWWVRGAGLAIGVIAAIGSAGLSTAISVGASISIAMALPFLEAALADIVAGTVVGPDTAGTEAGDALFAGTGALLGGMAQARGLKPLTSDGVEEYLATTERVKNEYIAQARFEAKDTPLDVMNQYSFLGSFARSLYVPSVNFGSSVSGTLSSIGSILRTSAQSVFPQANAAAFNPERFNKCADPAYEELGIAADVFCNVRYGLSDAELALDPNVVLDYMLDNQYITNDGTPRGEYEDFMTYCVERLDGWGETGEENSGDLQTGKYCMEESPKLSNFRVFTLDNSISDAMDDEEPSEEPEVAFADRPEEAIDRGRGWGLANNVDYSRYECDPRTTDLGVYTDPNYGYTIRICDIDFNSAGFNDTVASVVSTNTMNMLEAARADGIELGISDGMRKYGTPLYSTYTEHKYGTAIDLASPRSGQTICFRGVPSTRTGWGTAAQARAACERIGGGQFAAYEWLNANAEQYGYYNLRSEPWHWSTSGN